MSDYQTITVENMHELHSDYKLGMDIACLASRYNLTCIEVEYLLGIREKDDEFYRKLEDEDA